MGILGQAYSIFMVMISYLKYFYDHVSHILSMISDLLPFIDHVTQTYGMISFSHLLFFMNMCLLYFECPHTFLSTNVSHEISTNVL